MADKIVKDLSENFLNCCICMSTFKTPKMLPCIHSFCQECLLKYANTQKGNEIACPSCRKVCTLPEYGVKGLQTNFHLVNLAEKISLLEKLTPPTKETNVCESCKQREIAAFCFDCNFAVCYNCQDQHAMFPVLRSHTVVPIEDITDPNFQTSWRKAISPFCEVHSSEKLNFYCKTCSKLICRDCTIVMHPKPDHEYLDAVTHAGTMKEALTTLLDKSIDNLTKGINYTKRGKEGSEAIQQTSGNLKNEIAEHCHRKIAEVEKILNDQKSSLIKTVAKVESKKIADIEEKLQIAEDWVGRTKNTQDVTQRVIQEDNPLELLGMSAELVNAFETLQLESEDLGWCDSQLQQAIMFNPGDLSDIHLGDCNYRAEVVATDPYGNFILCHFEPHNKMFYMRLLMKSSKYTRSEKFSPYQWKHEIPTGAKLRVTAGGQDLLYVGLGKVVAAFNCKSKECLNEKVLYDKSEPNMNISCMSYSPTMKEVFVCVNGNKVDRWDKGFNRLKSTYSSKFRVTFMFPYENDILLGSEQLQLHKYALNRNIWTSLKLAPPPDFDEGEIAFYQGFRKEQRRVPGYQHHHVNPPLFGSAQGSGFRFGHGGRFHLVQGSNFGSHHYTTDDFVCFAVWVFVECGKNKPTKWILKEYCTRTETFLGELDDLGGDDIEVPSALHSENIDNGGMAIYLCDSQGNVTSYKREGNKNNPAPYKRYYPQ